MSKIIHELIHLFVFFCIKGIKIYELVALLALSIIFTNNLANDNLYNNVLLL